MAKRKSERQQVKAAAQQNTPEDLYTALTEAEQVPQEEQKMEVDNDAPPEHYVAFAGDPRSK